MDRLVDHLFRHSAGQMVAALTRQFGPHHLGLAEEVVQDALAKALETWRFRGVPDDPRAWLFRVARNRALDILRRDTNLSRKLAHAGPGDGVADARFGHLDDELAMLFMCCHPALSREAAVTLTLKAAGGFHVHEIAAAFLAEPATVAQRVVRAKRTLIQCQATFGMPTGAELAERLAAVLDVLFLMFNEGYAAHSGERLIRGELCGEAVRLTRLLCAHPATAQPAAFAMLSLLLLQSSRLGARTDDEGDLLLIAEQDRSLWDRVLIAEGIRALDRAARGNTITRFHVQAAIASVHAVAPSAAATDWNAILSLYDDLMQIAPSAVVALNRAVAVARVHGPDAGIAALERLRDDTALRHYFPYPAVMAGLWLEVDRPDEAAEWYRRALPLAGNPAERRFVERRLGQCGAAAGGDDWP